VLRPLLSSHSCGPRLSNAKAILLVDSQSAYAITVVLVVKLRCKWLASLISSSLAERKTNYSAAFRKVRAPSKRPCWSARLCRRERLSGRIGGPSACTSSLVQKYTDNGSLTSVHTLHSLLEDLGLYNRPDASATQCTSTSLVGQLPARSNALHLINTAAQPLPPLIKHSRGSPAPHQ
jgi:hypothetical protein